jgi:hypothetical protein
MVKIFSWLVRLIHCYKIFPTRSRSYRILTHRKKKLPQYNLVLKFKPNADNNDTIKNYKKLRKITLFKKKLFPLPNTSYA